MRIISSFHDYYDCMLSTNFSKEPLYIREGRETKDTIQTPYTDSIWWRTTPAERDILDMAIGGVVGFCGRLYPFIKYEGICFYNESKEFLHPILASKLKEFKYDKNNVLMPVGCQERNEMYDSPIFLMMEKRKSVNKNMIINPCLKDVQFFRIKPPQVAFQEIEMWLSNRASPEKPIPLVSNNDMIEAKGFDLKSSFRKEKNVK